MRGRVAFAILAGVLVFSLLAAAILAEVPAGPPTPLTPPWIGEALWSTRGLDLAIQAFIVLTGVFAILLLLREEPGGVPHG